MKHLNERREYVVQMQEVAGGEAWGTTRGALVFRRIDGQLVRLPDRTQVVLEFTGIARADVSFFREAIVEVVRKHRPRLLFIVANLVDADVQANLESALELRGESLLLRHLKERPLVLGKKLPEEQNATLRALQTRLEFTSGMLTGKPFELGSSTASARLSALWKAGLIDRAQGAAPSGGKEYKYFAIS
jgi:hypothetical protein